MVKGKRAGGGVRGRRDCHCNGRYASYWNAFYFICQIVFFYFMTSRFLWLLYLYHQWIVHFCFMS